MHLLFKAYSSPWTRSTVTAILSLRKARLGRIWWLAQGHTAGKQQNEEIVAGRFQNIPFSQPDHYPILLQTGIPSPIYCKPWPGCTDGPNLVSALLA